MKNIEMLLIDSAYAALEILKNNDGRMISGHNGLYIDPETSVRNTSHWLLVFAKAYELSKDQAFIEAVCQCANYLLLDCNFPHSYTYFCRVKKGKDKCNGLIGQAWVIEALAKSHSLLDDPRYIKRAIECFNLHPQQINTGLWERIEITGEKLGLDCTFNHQLWFCMAGTLIMSHSDEVEKKVHVFLDNFNNNLVLRGNGRIGHQIYLDFYRSKIKPNIRAFIRKGWKADNIEKEIGYHAFNTYALSVIKSKMPDHALWKNTDVIQLIDYLASDEYVNNIGSSKYGFPYNPPGIEVAYTFQVFSDMQNKMSKSVADKLLIKQFVEGFDVDESMMNKNGTKDKFTHAARIYEATRLAEEFYDLDVPL
jgi:hypothetical protein